MERVFVDTSVLIWAFNYPESNSATIVKMITKRKLHGITSQKAIEEMELVLTGEYDSSIFYKAKKQVLYFFQVIPRERISGEMEKWRGKIKEKDLEHLATAKALGIRVLLAVDRDFEPFQEYMTPKEFLKARGFEANETDY